MQSLFATKELATSTRKELQLDYIRLLPSDPTRQNSVVPRGDSLLSPAPMASLFRTMQNTSPRRPSEQVYYSPPPDTNI